MPVAIPQVLVIPYGTAEWSLAGFSVEGFSTSSLRLRAPFPCVAINRAAGEPLRLNNTPYEFGFVPNLDAGAEPAMVLKDYLKGLCRPWDNLGAGFVEAYFRFISDVVEEHNVALAAKLGGYEGLYDYRDWLFSAPIPLPRAHLPAPPEAGATGTPADFVRVDFAFWLGDRLVAAHSAQSALTPRRAREYADRLRLAGIEVVPFAAADLAGDARGLFTRVLSRALAFWEGDVLPVGPFRSPALEE
jgi:hypothetical protein